jgi:hypothetical protein
VTTTPAGIGTVAVTYNGSSTPPTNAGSYTVVATLTNDNYLSKPVSGTLVIAKAPATVTVGTVFVYDGTPKQAKITTNPAGLTIVSVTYDGSSTPPTNAGVYQVEAQLSNPNFEAPVARGTLTITPATPVLNWASPGTMLIGTPLSRAQLNATASGVEGVEIFGEFLYTPAAGSVLGVGPQLLRVDFTPSSTNYSRTSKTVQISVIYRFAGFFEPVKNPPVMNTVRAGRAIPIKFSLGRYEGLQVMKVPAPVVTNVQCTLPSEDMADDDAAENSSGLRADGYKYTYVWKTNASWVGSCRKMVITLADGTSHAALFRFVTKPGQDKGKNEDKGKSKAAALMKGSK